MKESNTVLDVIKTRRSIRKFDGTKITEEFMQQILEAGRWAPSGATAQPWRFIVVTEKEKIKSRTLRGFPGKSKPHKLRHFTGGSNCVTTQRWTQHLNLSNKPITK